MSNNSRDIFRKPKGKRKNKKKSKSVTFKTVDDALYSQAHNSVITCSSDSDEELQETFEQQSQSSTDEEPTFYTSNTVHRKANKHKKKRNKRKSNDSTSPISNQDETMSWFKRVNSALGNILVSKQPSELDISEIDELTNEDKNSTDTKIKSKRERKKGVLSSKKLIFRVIENKNNSFVYEVKKSRKSARIEEQSIESRTGESSTINLETNDSQITKRAKLSLSGGRLCTSVLSASGIPSHFTGKYRWYKVTDGEMSRIDKINDSTYHPHLNDVGCKIYCQWIPTGINTRFVCHLCKLKKRP